MWEAYVIDADMSDVDEAICVCPVQLDRKGNITSVVSGFNIITSKEGLKDYNIIAVVSLNGDDSVAEAFYNKLKGE